MLTHKILTREFILCFFAQFAFTSVFHALTPTLPLYLSRLKSTEIEIGILIGIMGVSSLLLRPIVGRGLLRIPEKRFMMMGALLYVLTSVSLLIAPPFWPLLIVRIFQGVGMAFFYTSASTLIANITPGAHLGQSLSYFYLSFNTAMALAPSIGMLLINHFGFVLLFWVCAGLSLCSLSIASQLENRKVHPVELSMKDDAFLNRKAIPPSIIIFFTHLIWGALAAFFPLYAVDQGVANPGLFFAAYAVMLISGRVLGGRITDLYSREKVILPCLTTYIVAMVILAFSKTLPMFILVASIWGIGNAFLVPTLVAYTLDRVGSARGPAMGTITAIGDLGTGLGPASMGVVLRLTSYPMMFLCLALMGALNLCYFYFFLRKKEKWEPSFRKEL
ncbi:MAG: MFS transporter [Thermodesulfobacteriota bacterium]